LHLSLKMTFANECKKLFGTKSLYEVLNLNDKEKASYSQDELKKAYYRASLQYHPDRQDHDAKDVATKKFQILSRSYSVLSDPERRAIYDETGIVDDAEVLDESRDWYSHWRRIFKPVSQEDISSFFEKYRGSEDEKNDLKAVYLRYKGNMDAIMESIPGADQDQEPRLGKILMDIINSGEIPEYKIFTEEPQKKKDARKRRAERERKEFEDELEQATGSRSSSMSNLEALIRKRNEDRMTDMTEALEAKYGRKRPAVKGAVKGKETDKGTVKEAPASPKAKKSTKRK